MRALKVPNVSRSITRFSLKFPGVVFAIVSVLIILSFYGISRLKIDNDLMHWLPESDKYVKIFKEVDEKFGSSEVGLILVKRKNGDIFDPAFLSSLRKVLDEVKNIEGVNNVVSILNYMDIKSEGGTVEISDLIPPGSESDPEFLQRLRRYVLEEKKDFFVSRIVSADGSSTLVQIDFSRDYPIDVLAQKVKEEFLEKASRVGLLSDAKVEFSGFPFVQIVVSENIKRDMARLIPIIVVLVVAVLFFVFRNARGVVLPLVVVSLSTLFAMGWVALVGEKLDMALEILPVLIVALGVDYTIHFYHHFVHLRGEVSSSEEASLLTVEKIGVALFLAFITTFIGFSSFLTSDMHIIRKFGIFSGVGIFFVYILTVSFMPAVLKLLPLHKKEITKEGVSFVSGLSHSLARFVTNNSRKIVLAAFVMLFAGIISFFFIRTEINFINYFPRSSPVRKAHAIIEKDFSGSLNYMLYLRGDMRTPAAFRELLRASAWMKSLERGARPVSMAYFLMELNHHMSGKWALPETTDEMENLLFFFEGNRQINSMWDDRAALARVFLKGSSTAFSKMIYRTGLKFTPVLSGKYFYVSRAQVGDELVSKYNLKEASDIVYYVLLPYVKGHDFVLSYSMDNFLGRFFKRKQYEEIMDYRGKFYSAVESALASVAGLPIELDPEELSISVKKYLVDEMGYSVSWASCRKFASMVSSGTSIEKSVGESFRGIPVEDMEMLIEDLRVFMKDYIGKKKVASGIALLKKNLSSYVVEGWNSVDEEALNYVRSAMWILLSDYAVIPASSGEPSLSAYPVISIRAEQTGLPPIFAKAVSRVNRSLASSFSLTFLLIFLILLLNFGKFKDALLGMSAIIFAVMLSFVIMAIFGIPLTPQTAFVAAVTIGLGIDYTIHFSTRYRRELLEHGDASSGDALEITFRETGAAMLSSAATDVMGFLVLLLASILPLREFGILQSFTIAASAVGALTILPAFLLVFKGFRLKNIVNTVSALRSSVAKNTSKSGR